MIISVRYVKVLQRTSAPVIIDATFHQHQHFKMNRALMNIRTGPVVKDFSSVYSRGPFG